jgi:hypothetical protein
MWRDAVGVRDNTSSVALVMMDNRRPDLAQWIERHAEAGELSLNAQARLVTTLTAYLNARYACRHGYTLLFYQLSQPGCAHPLWGDRPLTVSLLPLVMR